MKDSVHVKYLIASEHDKLWGLTVSTVGYQHIAPHSVYPTRNHPASYMFSTEKGRVLDEYILLYIANGKGSFSSSLKDRTKLNMGSMILLFPGEWHNYSPLASVGWDEYWIGFKGPHIENYIANGFFNKEKEIFDIGPRENIIRLYRDAISAAKEQNAGYQQVLAGIVHLLLGITNSGDKNSSLDQIRAAQQINQAKMIMFENSHTNIKAEEVAEKVCLSYSWFRSLFKQYTGMSPHLYIQELRIEKSKELLTTTMLNCQEIAYKVGYDNPDYFGAVFKKKTGISPLKYREFVQGKDL